MGRLHLHGDEWDRTDDRVRNVKGERILLSRPGPTLDYWDGED